jgi:hypothetical protein
MFNEMDRAHHTAEDHTRHLEEQRASMREAAAFARYAHSKSGLLAQFVRRLADRIDPTGQQRRRL